MGSFKEVLGFVFLLCSLSFGEAQQSALDVRDILVANTEPGFDVLSLNHATLMAERSNNSASQSFILVRHYSNYAEFYVLANFYFVKWAFDSSLEGRPVWTKNDITIEIYDENNVLDVFLSDQLFGNFTEKQHMRVNITGGQYLLIKSADHDLEGFWVGQDIYGAMFEGALTTGDSVKSKTMLRVFCGNNETATYYSDPDRPLPADAVISDFAEQVLGQEYWWKGMTYFIPAFPQATLGYHVHIACDLFTYPEFESGGVPIERSTSNTTQVQVTAADKTITRIMTSMFQNEIVTVEENIPATVWSTRPITVVVIIRGAQDGQGNSVGTSPAMITMVPHVYWLDAYYVNTPNDGTLINYLVVVADENGKDNIQIAPVVNNDQYMFGPDAAGWEQIGNSMFYSYTLPVEAAMSYAVFSFDKPFGLYQYYHCPTTGGTYCASGSFSMLGTTPNQYYDKDIVLTTAATTPKTTTTTVAPTTEAPPPPTTAAPPPPTTAAPPPTTEAPPPPTTEAPPPPTTAAPPPPTTAAPPPPTTAAPPPPTTAAPPPPTTAAPPPPTTAAPPPPTTAAPPPPTTTTTPIPVTTATPTTTVATQEPITPPPEFVGCPCLHMDGLDSRYANLNGLWILQPDLLNGKPYYRHANCDYYLYYWADKNVDYWLVGPTLGDNTGVLVNHDIYRDPGYLQQYWRKYDGQTFTWNQDSMVTLTCDCNGAASCPVLEVVDSLNRFPGKFHFVGIHDGRPLYKNDISQLYLYYNIEPSSCQRWVIGSSTGLQSTRAYVYDASFEPVSVDSTWKVRNDFTTAIPWSPDSTMRVSCATR